MIFKVGRITFPPFPKYEMGDDGLTADELEYHYKFVTI